MIIEARVAASATNTTEGSGATFYLLDTTSSTPVSFMSIKNNTATFQTPTDVGPGIHNNISNLSGLFAGTIAICFLLFMTFIAYLIFSKRG